MVSSSSSSSHAPMAVDPTDRLSVLMWLPEGLNSMLVDLIAQEENEIHRGALGRCLSALHLRTISSHALAAEEVLSEATYSEMHFFPILHTICKRRGSFSFECVMRHALCCHATF